jgi:hypothetical protein
VAVRTAIAAAVAGAVGLVVHNLVGRALAPDPATLGRSDIPGLVGVIVVVSAAFGLMFIAAALVLRIEELRSIVGIMVDALRRPRRSP